MGRSNSFFARKGQAEFIQRVYRETPVQIQKFFQQENELLSQALAGSKNVLELGCGFGRAVDFVMPAIRYTGIDIGFTYVAEAKRKYPERSWLCGDATRVPFEQEAFDTIFCIQNTIGNMEGIEKKVISESRRALKREGKLIISAYSEDSFDLRKLWYDRLVDIGIFGHVWMDPHNPKVVRSDTGWSSRCFERDELKALLGAGTVSLEITKLDSFLYFCVAEM